jgi:hypothetical protein
MSTVGMVTVADFLVSSIIVRTVSLLKMTAFWDQDGEYAPLKCRYTSMRIHGVISQKAGILILDAVRTRNVTFPSYIEDISESNSEDNDVAQTQII